MKKREQLTKMGWYLNFLNFIIFFGLICGHYYVVHYRYWVDNGLFAFTFFIFLLAANQIMNIWIWRNFRRIPKEDKIPS